MPTDDDHAKSESIPSPASLFSMRGRVALVTGAGSGLGRVCARALAAADAQTVVADLDAAAADGTVRLISEAGFSASAVTVDVSDPASVQTMAEQVRGRHEAVHVLVNNAGISTPARLTHEIPIDEWNRVIAVDLSGVFYCSRAVLPLMMGSGSGSVINIASIVGLRGLDARILAQAGYVAAKAGVIGLTLQMAGEYGQYGVRVNAIAPGWHLGTNLGANVGNFTTEVEQRRLVEQLIDHTPLRRTGQPEELAGLVVYLASGASSFLSGQIIAHDGGWTAW